eukprot:scaffold11882_cov123-Cylindrotheca_fusiformis.AAC.2
MKTASFLSLFTALTAFQSTVAAPAGYNFPIRAAKKHTSPGSRIQHILEQRRLQGETICTRTNLLGTITTTCEEASDVQSTCTVTTDGTCSYEAHNLSVFEDLISNYSDLFTDFNVTLDSTDVFEGGDPTGNEVFDEFVSVFADVRRSGICECADSTPDCSMTNLADYSFNACTADQKYSYTCSVEQGNSC